VLVAKSRSWRRHTWHCRMPGPCCRSPALRPINQLHLVLVPVASAGDAACALLRGSLLGAHDFRCVSQRGGLEHLRMRREREASGGRKTQTARPNHPEKPSMLMSSRRLNSPRRTPDSAIDYSCSSKQTFRVCPSTKTRSAHLTVTSRSPQSMERTIKFKRYWLAIGRTGPPRQQWP
jgi:hypothetical protein